jgi:hypothetical protein
MERKKPIGPQEEPFESKLSEYPSQRCRGGGQKQHGLGQRATDRVQIRLGDYISIRSHRSPIPFKKSYRYSSFSF